MDRSSPSQYQTRGGNGAPKALPKNEISREQLQLLKSLGYGQNSQRARESGRAGAPLIVFEGKPLTSAPITLTTEDEGGQGSQHGQRKPLKAFSPDPYAHSMVQTSSPQYRGGNSGPRALPQEEINPQKLQMLKSLGYGKQNQRLQESGTTGAPLIVFEGQPLTSAPITLATEDDDDYGSPQGKRKKPLNIDVCPDPYVNSDKVVGLKKDVFKKFIRYWDASMVLFYNPFDSDCRWARVNVKEAACATERDDHAYAAVDCTKECELCNKQGIKSFPALKLYSRGMAVNTFQGDTVLSGKQIQSFVENTPVLEGVHKHKCCVQ